MMYAVAIIILIKSIRVHPEPNTKYIIIMNPTVLLATSHNACPRAFTWMRTLANLIPHPSVLTNPACICTRVAEIGGNPPDLAAKPPDPAKWPGAEGAVKMAPQAKIFQNTVT